MKKPGWALCTLFFFLGLAGPSPAEDQAPLYYQAGNGFYARKKYDLALRYYDAALQLNSRLWQAYQAEGNCYYAKGQKERSLPYYQKCLDLHPDNTALRSFVKSLRASLKKAGSAPSDENSRAQAKKYLLKSEGFSDAQFELSPSLGVALYSDSTGIGLGGGLFYMFDSNFGVGGMTHLYLFGTSSSSTSPYTTAGFTQGTLKTTDSGGLSFLEVVPAVKYKFDGSWLRPYLVGGIGLVLAAASASETYDYEDGPPAYGAYSNASLAASSVYLLCEIGAGLEVPLDPDLKVFAEARLDEILSPGSDSYMPLEAGLAFKL